MDRQELEAKRADELVEVQSTHVLRYIFTNIILLGKLETEGKNKKFKELLKILNDLIPLKPIGAMLIEGKDDGKVWLSIKPCTHDHSFDLQLQSVPTILSTPEEKKKLMNTISLLIFVIRQSFSKFVSANSEFMDRLIELLPNSRKNVSLNVDPSNTTLYVYEDFPLRSGIFLERDSFIKSKREFSGKSAEDAISDTIMQIEDSIMQQQEEMALQVFE